MQSNVQVVEEILHLPTYREPLAEELPMFAENRVHQRSSGNPYPNRVVSDIDREHVENKAYTTIRLENEYLRIVLLPELGGRIYSAFDKVNNYDFFYKQHVIKPALIGMLGSWISGGVEFNWPSHHRPSTFMPTDYFIEHEDNGAVTVWMSEHDPLDRMKGMVGIRLAPNESVFDTLMRVYNRTPIRHSFLWWENAAVPVNESYRIFFPHDVAYVQFHYRKNVTTYPVASGQYNGIRMGDGTDIRFHKNTRQPTSYFSASTKYDFFGGYDEGKQCGVVHVADHYTSIGKKMFTWAYNQLSQSWERALTDTNGAYAELMASSYSSNQPDFAWLEPYETKKFKQSWYPIGKIGVPDCATHDVAIRLDQDGVYIQATKLFSDAIIICDDQQFTLSLTPCDLEFIACGNVNRVIIKDEPGRILLRYNVEKADITTMPEPLPSNPTLESLRTAQDCYLAGVHVDQYRDPAILPDAYWNEGLKRDPEHFPTLLAMVRFLYLKGRLDDALIYANRCYKVITKWNFHPESGELFFLTGLIHEAMGQTEKAYDFYQNAHWNEDVRSRTMVRISLIDGRRMAYEDMLLHAEMALEQNSENSLAKAAAAIALYRLGDKEQAYHRIEVLLSKDPLDHLARYIACMLKQNNLDAFIHSLHSDPAQTAIDIAFDLIDAGEHEWASILLGCLPYPTIMTQFILSHTYGMDTDQGKAAISKASTLTFGHAYPWRHKEEAILKAVIACDKNQSKAHFGLGCLLYAKRRYSEAVKCWEEALNIYPSDYMTLRNLAVAYYSHLNRREEALALLKQALSLKEGDNQLIWETSYLMTRLKTPMHKKLEFLSINCTGKLRDDIAIEWAQAYNLCGQYLKALELLSNHNFVPCEGGEHAVAEQYMFAHHALGRIAVREQRYEDALSHFKAAQTLPDNLGAGLWNEVMLVPHQYFEGYCLEKLGRIEAAEAIYKHICILKKDYFSDMHLSELPCWQAMAQERLGHPAVSRELLAGHVRTYRAALSIQDPGFFKTTPFFNSYTEPSVSLRKASCWYQMAFAALCLGRENEARDLLHKSLEIEPAHLYSNLSLTEPIQYEA